MFMRGQKAWLWHYMRVGLEVTLFYSTYISMCIRTIQLISSAVRQLLVFVLPYLQFLHIHNEVFRSMVLRLFCVQPWRQTNLSNLMVNKWNGQLA